MVPISDGPTLMLPGNVNVILLLIVLELPTLFVAVTAQVSVLLESVISVVYEFAVALVILTVFRFH